MTALVSLLFITVIPIDYKITNFSLYFYNTLLTSANDDGAGCQTVQLLA